MKIDMKTGKPLRSISLSNKFFGEGITILRDTIYQLTWKAHKVIVYTLRDFKKIKEFNINTQGWGLTNDGQKLIASDGSGMLYYYDPSTFKLLSKSSIMEGNANMYNLNELEYIDGYVYANQYGLPYVLKIDLATSSVVAKYDLKKYITTFKNLLADNGKLFIAVPNYTSYDAMSYGTDWAGYDVPRHLYHFTPQTMQWLMRESGFRIVDIKPMWFDSFYVSLLSSKYKNGSPNWFGAVWTGLISNFKAMNDVKKCSSVIYIVSK
jgi:hypothetical protein